MSKKRRRWDAENIAKEAREQQRRDKNAMLGVSDSPIIEVKQSAPSAWPIMSTANVTRAAYGLSEITTHPLQLPTRHQFDTIRVFKLAKLALAGGVIKLQGVGSNAVYETNDTAVCHHETMGMFPTLSLLGAHRHEAPDPQCTCGFYGVTHKNGPQVVTSYESNPYVRVEAELFGRVIRHRRGYRAQRQQVLSVGIPRRCRTIKPPAMSNAMVTFNLNPYGRAEEPCSKKPIGLRIDAGGVVPACADHAPLGVSPLTDLAKMLGTEVRWFDG